VKILLTGASGQLGFELRRALAPLGEVLAVDHVDCDLADAAAIGALLARVAPDLIVNPAAHTAVDRAESEPALARAINAEAPRVLGEWAAARRVPVIHYSTDYVFDGAKAGAYLETDPTNPQGVYGLTKRDGETALIAANLRHLVLRTSWVVGAHGANFAKTMLRLAAERDELRVVADQWGAPTSAALLADCTAHLVRRWQQDADVFPWGLYHLVAGGETNWCDYARFVIGRAIEAGRPLRATPERVRAIATADYPTPARRPANSRLDTTRFRETFGLRLPDWREGVGHILEQIL
jgi:dTDP-4-dehydrorhamnose reductase